MRTDVYRNGVLVESNVALLDKLRNSKIDFIKEIASLSIFSAGLDTATQQNAALGIYPPERCEAIKSYIAACRNEYLRCKVLILAATSNEAADSVQYIPPSVPEGL